MMVATPAATRPHGWVSGPSAMAYQGDMLSMPVCHLGVFLGFLGWPIRRQCRTAMNTRTAPIRIFTASPAKRRCGVGFGRLVAGDQHRARHHDGQRDDPPEDEGGSLAHAVLRRQHQDEPGQRNRFEGDDQPDEQQVDDHRALPPSITLIRLSISGAPLPSVLPRPSRTRAGAGTRDGPNRRSVRARAPSAAGRLSVAAELI